MRVLKACRGWLLTNTAGIVLIVALRIRFVFVPLSPDEGGYSAIARAWSGGARLYRDVWVDRPLGLMLIYRLAIDVGLGSPRGLRVVAILFCILGTLACGSIARTLVGPSAVLPTVLVTGVIASVPQFEAYIANAELLSTAVGAVALAVLLRTFWRRDNHGVIGLIAAGALGAAALSIKQSGFDAYGAGLITMSVICWRRHHTWWTRVRSSAVSLCGFLAVIALVLAHAALTGWHRWWYAQFGYRATRIGHFVGEGLPRLEDVFRANWPAVVPAVLTLGGLTVAAWRTGRRSEVGLVGSWLGLAMFAFVIGGEFWMHYWMLLVFPIGAGLGVLLSELDHQRTRVAIVTALLVGPLVISVDAMTRDRGTVEGNYRLLESEHVAAWVKDHRARGDVTYALCNAPELYGNLEQAAPFPYLWLDGVWNIPDSPRRLNAYLRGTAAPRWVARYEAIVKCDRTGQLGQSLADNYHLVTMVDQVVIYEHNAASS